jgi:hypothetical protein
VSKSISSSKISPVLQTANITRQFRLIGYLVNGVPEVNVRGNFVKLIGKVKVDYVG